jgi:hypothetical protein
MPCDRCGASPSQEPDLGLEDEKEDDPRLAEMQMSYGVVTCLCFSCRKAWGALSFRNELFRDYTTLGFEYKLWQIKYKKSPFKTDVEEGRKLYKALDDLELKLFDLTKNWIKAGAASGEK